MIAKRQRVLLLTVCIYFMTAGLIYMFSDSLELTSTELEFLSQLLLLPIVLARIIFTARLCWKLYSKVDAIIMTVLSTFPVLELLVLLQISYKTNKIISSKGFKVGLMGADTKEIAKAI